MDDLGREIKQALEAEWGAGADAPGLGAWISRRPPLHHRSHQAVPTMAALAVAGLLVAAGTFALLNRPPRGHVSGPVATRTGNPTPAALVASPSPSPRPEADYGVSPAGVAVFYYIDQRQPSWLVAMDWSGQIRGTVKLAPNGVGLYGGAYPISSPDGSRLLVAGTVYDSAGNNLGKAAADKQSVVWSDDNRHLCGLVPGASETAVGIPQQLFTVLPGQPKHIVGTVGTAYNQAGGRVYACSLKSGLAVVVQAYNENASESWLVSLATGRVLHHQVYAQSGNDMTNLVVAPNASFIAENHTAQPGQTVIRDARTGRLVASPAGSPRVVAFSSDGNEVLLYSEAANVKTWTVRTTAGQVLRWSPALPPAGQFAGASPMVRPGVPGFVIVTLPTAVTCGTSKATACGPGDNLQDLLLVPVVAPERVAAQGVSAVPNW